MMTSGLVKNRFVSKSFIAFGCGLIFCVAGCSQPATDDAKSDVKSREAPPSDSAQLQPVDAQVANVSPQLLTGVWFGQARLDRDKLQQKIAGLSPQQQQLVAAKANSFLSTVMAMEFRSNGTVENEIEIVSLDGQSLRDGSVGQWKVLESTADGLMVQTEEQLANGAVVKDKMFYRFFDNGNQVAIAARVSEDLEGCDTMIVFERRTLPPTNVAASASETQTK